MPVVDQRAGDFVLFDCGNFTDPATETTLLHSVYTARAMELMCYDALTLSEQELRLTQEQLVQVLGEFDQAQVVSANIQFVAPAMGADRSRELNELVRPSTRIRVGPQWLFVTGVVLNCEMPHGLTAQLGAIVNDANESLELALEDAKDSDCIVILVSGISGSALTDVPAFKRADIIVGLDHREQLEPGHSADGELPNQIVLGKGLDRGRVIGCATAVIHGGCVALVISLDKLVRTMDENELILDLLDDMAAEITELHRKRQAEQSSIDPSEVVDYLGNEACVECHGDVVSSYELARHAKAYSSIKQREEQRNGMCLPCHTTGYGEPTGFSLVKPIEAFQGVGCESCHGPGEVHVQLMRGLGLTGPLDNLNENGLHEVTEAVCVDCHVETTDPGFDFQRKRVLVHPVADDATASLSAES
jgi:hypothetical protein